MFQKLVSGLPFSPALVGSIGFYARRLKQEEATRRVGLLFTAMALVVQSLAVVSPPEPANAASASDFIFGGVSSVSAVVAAYDDPTKDFKKIIDYAGITRDELAAMRDQSINSKEYGTGSGTWLTWGRVSRFSAEQGEVRHDISGTVVYSKPLWLYDTTSWTIPHGSTYAAFRGYSAKLGNFAISKSCGNLISTTLPTPPPPPPPTPPATITVCRPGTGVISILETERRATDLPASSDVCKPQPAPTPVAACSSLAVKKIERTKFKFTGNAVAENGATISAYTFTVYKNDSNGAVVTTARVASTAATADSGIIELKEAGTYAVRVTVTTSLGDKTDATCVTSVTVTPPEKCSLHPEILATDKDCQPCPANTSLWYKDSDCSAKLASEKTAANLTQNGQPAAQVVANGGDRIQFTLTMYNVGKVLATTDFKENISDVLEYATINDNGGSQLIETPTGNGHSSSYLSWGNVELKPGEKIARTFTVKVVDTIPLTPRGTSEPSSYDCIMTNTFGSTINISMNCPAPKLVESVVEQLPSTGPTASMTFAGVIGSIVVYFYSRSRQLSGELRLIRKDFNAGTL